MNNEMKEDEMGRACSIHEDEEACIKGLGEMKRFGRQ
jgi:hypothetical protein